MILKILHHLAILIIGAFFLTSCATSSKQVEVKERYFWPPLPEEPKIEWIGAYNNHMDLSDGQKGFLNFLTGTEIVDGLLFPYGIAADGHGKVYVGDIGKFNVTVFDFNTRDTHILAGDVLATMLNKPSGIDLDDQGNIYVGDMNKKKIIVFSKNETPLRVIELSGVVQTVGIFKVDSLRKRIIIPDPKAHQVVITDMEGKPIKTIVLFNNGERMDGFRFPAAVALDPKGNIVVADTVNARIVRFTPEGEFLSIIGMRGDTIGTIDFVKGVATDSEGHIYMVDFRADRLQIFNDKGQTLMAIGDKGLKDNIGSFKSPSTVYIDKNDTIYITETAIKRFQVLQYITKDYLARNPITKERPAAKPISTINETGNKP